MTTGAKSSDDQATGCRCGEGKAAAADAAEAAQPAAAEVPQAAPATYRVKSKGCCCGG